MASGTQTYEVDKSEFVFGRGGKSDLIVPDPGISREHLRIKLDNGIIYIMDLKSLNGTQINACDIAVNEYVALQEKSVITFGKCAITIRISLKKSADLEKTEVVPEVSDVQQNKITPLVAEIEDVENKNIEVSEVQEPAVPEVKAEAKADEKPADKPEFNKLMDLSAFPKTEEDYRLSFKNVGLDLPKYKNPGEHAKEIIAEAEYQKYAIIKSAEVSKSKIINDTRILSKQASDEAYAQYKKMVDHLLENARLELKKLRTDTAILLDEKRLQANDEIQKLWEEHEERIRADKEKQHAIYENENKIKLDLSIEKTRSDMFAERHKILTEAESEVLKKKIAFQAEIENEKNEHRERIKIYSGELLKIQQNIEECKKVSGESNALRDSSELELSKVMSQLKSENEKLAIVSESFKETQEKHKVIEHELANFNDTKTRALMEIKKAEDELSKLSSNYSLLAEKKQLISEDIQKLSETLSDAKAKSKSDLEIEYANLKNIEAKKFDDFKANELKELQKIRDVHTDSIKNFSLDLSQEIATKLELLASKNGSGNFDFEKNLELINSVIQIKSAITTGSESKHAQQLEGWKNRKRKENFNLVFRGFAAGLVVFFLGKLGYERLGVDPRKAELAQIAMENQRREVENRYIPVKSDKYYDNYVDTTIFTENFSEVYLDQKNQQEWVNYATRYFLRQWKVDEEKVIRVISNSTALVQNINEAIPNLKKTKFKSDISKLKELEEGYISKQAQILGTNVRYEAYKKIEKEFFQSKINGRVPASQ